MKLSAKLLIAIIIPLTLSCSDRHLINDPEYLKIVAQAFNERKELAVKRAEALFAVFDRFLSVRQKEGLEFLYAYMPLSDLADYTGDFFLSNVNASLRARDESPWGKDIPEEIFLHYVLPCRVNNENLDSFRIVYYDEIMGRIKQMSILDAALEINHWCHEKVNYAPADIRTSAPMSTILSARGRCGEESTFTVAALRTAGIPARQVYTPKWAHTDDNHAWVEVWCNGSWYYMGACEPEPVIDRGWFTEPARRAMLIHTKSFGASLKGENAVNRHKNYTEVNNLSKYAVTKTIFVKVTDRDNRPVKNARVEYQLYNYAEFYPIAVVPTDSNGLSSFETGLGDLLIWASAKDIFTYKKISVNETDTLHLELNRKPGGSYNINLDLNVPVAPPPLPVPSQDLIDINAKRFNAENEIRNKYISTWIKPEETEKLAIRMKVDKSRMITVFIRSMGNYNEIRKFLSETPDSLIQFAMALLNILPDKDLRDTKAAILSDHLINSFKDSLSRGAGDVNFLENVLNPRVANEILSPWRSYFLKMLPPDLRQKATSDPRLIAGYLEQNVTIDSENNYYNTPVTPIGVNELKVSDAFSRSICFVAMCRSLGIPARLETGSNVPQYYLGSEWHDLFFSDQVRPAGRKGFIKLVTSETRPVPGYYIHFTLARFDNGRYNTLEYQDGRKITDFKDELALAQGSFMLVTGNRLADGRILTAISFFDLAEGEHKTVDVKIRKEAMVNSNQGNIDVLKVTGLFDLDDKALSAIKDKGMVILWAEPEKEPTKHIFNDLIQLKQEFDEWGGYFLVLTYPGARWSGFSALELKSLPANILFGHDNKILPGVFNSSESCEIGLPYVVMADRYGKVLYSSSGYRIGTGEQLLMFMK
jgi:hypothetical protein